MRSPREFRRALTKPACPVKRDNAIDLMLPAHSNDPQDLIEPAMPSVSNGAQNS